MIDLDRLKELLAKAPPGPWEYDEVRTSCGRAFRIGSGEMLKAGKGCCIIYDDYPGNPDNERKANSELIVAAVNALPSLISALEAEREKVAKLREAIRPFADIGIGSNPDYVPIIRMDRESILKARAALGDSRTAARAYKETGDA